MPSMNRSALAVAGLGVAVAAARPLTAAALEQLIRYDTRRMMDGDVEPLLSRYADDATLTFPGESSWGRTYRGKDEIRGFLTRFLDAGIRGEIEEIIAQGPPWNTRVAIAFNDRAHAPDGTLVYENRAIIRAQIAWGKIRREEVYEDTQRVPALDEYLAAREPAGAASQPSVAA